MSQRQTTVVAYRVCFSLHEESSRIQLQHCLMPDRVQQIDASNQAGSPLVALASCKLDKQPEHYLQGHKECCACPEASGPCHVTL